MTFWWRGKEAIREWYRKDWEQFPEEKLEVENVSVKNLFALSGTNTVTVEWSVIGNNRHKEEFTNRGVSVIHLVKGKIAQMRVLIVAICGLNI